MKSRSFPFGKLRIRMTGYPTVTICSGLYFCIGITNCPPS